MELAQILYEGSSAIDKSPDDHQFRETLQGKPNGLTKDEVADKIDACFWTPAHAIRPKKAIPRQKRASLHDKVVPQSHATIAGVQRLSAVGIGPAVRLALLCKEIASMGQKT
ncbi:hypothetical protein N7520_009732 [Penicillium odoratum]|uniref:uncharacterized protein n=1 Tax=Penicillium odoratum TaxID=1167516 RepID=UPI002546A278|nr:uncharacterized protein N7520_009732 [Penicillium odoratum]KAJ5752815.1 hypothetical protein N7520_009732 [Penicillium odoratum]